jgi:phosphate transport system protein
MEHFERDLAAFKRKLLLMAGHAENSVARAVQALVERNSQRAAQVEEEDAVLDRLEIEIDEMGIQLLAKAPLASNLRLITAGMKISHDLERIGDEATTIARRVLDLNQNLPASSFHEIPQIAEIAIGMLRESLDAFVNRNSSKARQIIPRDKQVDALNKQVQRELAQSIAENPESLTRSLNLMTISKALERVADHATNIAEDVVYLDEALDIRHSGKLAG